MTPTEAPVAPAPETAKRPSPLDGIVVAKPETSNEKTRRYLCGIKSISGWTHLDRIVSVGPATFGKHSFIWEGEGPDARQVEIKGVINVLTDRQVEEVRAKLKFRYLRPVHNKEGNLIVGSKEIDRSDSGGVLVDEKTGIETRRPPEMRTGRTGPNDLPLVDFLTWDVVYEDKSMRGRVVTLEEARRIVAEAEAEIDRPLESVDATFESGKGGKATEKDDPKVEAALRALSTERPTVTGGPEVAIESAQGSKRAAPGKSVFGGAGRLPEGK